MCGHFHCDQRTVKLMRGSVMAGTMSWSYTRLKHVCEKKLETRLENFVPYRCGVPISSLEDGNNESDESVRGIKY